MTEETENTEAAPEVEAAKPEPKPEPKPKPKAKKSDAETHKLRTTGDFQMYDPISRTLIPAKGSVEVSVRNPFFNRQIAAGKLEKA